MAYNRDLQEDKLAMFGFFGCPDCLSGTAPSVISGAELNVEVIQSRLEDGF